MKKALLGVAVIVGMMAFAAPAFAQTTGFIEICKSSPAGAFPTGLSNTPSFTYTVSNGGGTVVVPNNSCSRPIAVTAGNVTVTETLASFFAVSSITTSPGSALQSSTLATGTAVVAVPASDTLAGLVTVNYTNVPVVGHIEICKNNASDSGLTGSFTFTITGPAGSGFTASATVPIGHCSFPIAVPAGVNTVTETAPNSVTSITTTPTGALVSSDLTTGTAVVTVVPDVAPGDTSRETIVTFANRTVSLKICKTPSDAGVTSPYTFTVSATEPAGGNPVPNRTVTVLPGQCQLVPGPYTNPNGTTGFRAGTVVTVSEGVVPGTAVTAITVTPANREIGPKVISPLPNPTQPGPAGSDVVGLGAGETVVDFTNDTVPGGTLKVCESPDGKAPIGTNFTFRVVSVSPGGINTTVTVPVGSCTLVPNPARTDGLWPYNAIVDIFQNAIPGLPFVPPVVVSPAARALAQGAAAVAVSIGSGDVTVATFNNDPADASSSGGSSSGGSLLSSAAPAPAGAIAAISGTTSVGSAGAAAHISSAKLLKLHGAHYLVVHVASSHGTAKIRVTELNKRGLKIRSFVTTVKTNRAARVLVPWSAGVKVVAAKLIS